MMCEDGRVAWAPQMARSLRKHCRKTSSMVGMQQRAFEDSVEKGWKLEEEDAHHRENPPVESSRLP